MSDVCKGWFKQWKARYDENINLWDTDQNECCLKITGHNLSHNAWRMLRISGAVDRMGGFANFSHYVNKCADTDYKVFDRQQKVINKVLKKFNPKTTAQERLFKEMKELIKEVKSDAR